MRVRVVCGRDVTIDTLWPTKRLVRVDLPTFGRPRMAAKPERKEEGIKLFRIVSILQPGPPGANPVKELVRSVAGHRPPVSHSRRLCCNFTFFSIPMIFIQPKLCSTRLR